MYINLKKLKDNHFPEAYKQDTKYQRNVMKEITAEQVRKQEEKRGTSWAQSLHFIEAETLVLAKKWDGCGKEIRKKRLSGLYGRSSLNCFHDKLLSQHGHGSRAPEQGNSLLWAWEQAEMHF